MTTRNVVYTARAYHAVLQERTGEQRVTALVEGAVLRVGRDPSCELQVMDDDVSRLHARVTLSEGMLLVEDTSTNGTRVGTLALHRARTTVPVDTVLGFGGAQLSVRARPPELRERAEEAVRPPLVAPSAVTPLPARVPDAVRPPPSAAQRVEQDSENQLRRDIHRRLLEHLDMSAIDPLRRDDPALRPRVLAALRTIVAQLRDRLPQGTQEERVVGEVADEALGLGPLEHLLSDPTITEIMVADPSAIYVERNGQLTRVDARFTDEERVRAVIERIVTPLGRRVDESSPMVDARLADGSRVNVIIRPLAIRGSAITIRRFGRSTMTMERLCGLDSLTPTMARFLEVSVQARKNIVVSGGTGSGKTTLLNVLSSAIPASERIVTIEDAAELKLSQPHVVALESRPPNMEGKGEVAIRDLLRNALRMRPDRIVVGECRGGEALDMLQAMNTGHDGSLTTTHANTPLEALARLETLCLMSGVELPSQAIREQLASSIQLIVQQARQSDGTRKITEISELCGLNPNGSLRLRPLYVFERSGTAKDGKVLGRFRSTGYMPSYLAELALKGLISPGEVFQ